MGLLDKLWDDVAAGPAPERGLGKFRKINTNVVVNTEGGDKNGKLFGRSLSMPSGPSTPTTPTTPTTPSAGKSPSARKEDVWRSVFNPGSNPATRGIGAQYFDNTPASSKAPTVYDWLYSGESRSKHV